MKYIILTLLIALMAMTSLYGQTGLERKVTGSSADVIGSDRMESKFSLFDLSRLEMNHSYSVAYFSGGGSSQTIAMYMNSMKYRISNPLTLNINLAWVHEPGKLLFKDRGTPTDYGKILPSFSLEYRPSDNFFMQISYQSVPSYLYNSNYGSYSGSYLDRFFRHK